MSQLSILNDTVRNYQLLQYKPLKEIQLTQLKMLANDYGFSWDYFQKTGIWKTVQEIENGTDKNPFPAVYERKPVIIQCKGCSKKFERRKVNQLFCTEICKNSFHNSKKS